MLVEQKSAFGATTNFTTLCQVIRAAVMAQPSDHKLSVSQSQCREILAILQEHRGEFVSAVILSRKSLQYSSRIFTLRRLGYKIVNRVEHVPGGGKHGFFKLLCEREEQALACLIPAREHGSTEKAARGETAMLFSSLPENHRDDG